MRELGLSERAALCDYRLAPLESRRDMAMLGVLHKVTLGISPPQLAALFPLRGAVTEHRHAHRLRYWRPLHNRQLHSHATPDSTEFFFFFLHNPETQAHTRTPPQPAVHSIQIA